VLHVPPAIALCIAFFSFVDLTLCTAASLFRAVKGQLVDWQRFCLPALGTPRPARALESCFARTRVPSSPAKTVYHLVTRINRLRWESGRGAVARDVGLGCWGLSPSAGAGVRAWSASEWAQGLGNSNFIAKVNYQLASAPKDGPDDSVVR